MQSNDLLQEISYLYELSLSLGNSLDPEENCRGFIKTLLKRKNLEFGGVWLRNENLPTEDYNSGFSRIYAHPLSRTTGKYVEENPGLQKILDEDFVYSAPISEVLCKLIGLHPISDQGVISIFKLDKIGFLVVLSSQEETSLDEKEKNKLRNVLQKLSVSLKGCLYHEKSVQDLITITKTKKELEAAKRRAEESEQLKSAFLANMSHEIRTPVNAIVGFSNLLSGPEVSLEQRDTFVKHIYNNSKDLLSLISDIIDYSKIEAKQLEIQKERHYINPLLYDIFQNHDTQRKLDDKVFQFHINLPENSNNNQIVTDLGRFQQVLNNFLSNAFKFTHEGEVEMGYFYAEEGGVPVFYVKDTGIGIPENKQELVFESFRQLEHSTTRKYGGSGLGLAINKKLVELLGGNTWLESRANCGSCFYFTVSDKDVKISQRQEIKKIETSKDAIIDSVDLYDFTGKNVLIAEDVRSNFNYLTAIIELTNANILWAKNGAEAVAKCCDESMGIDLVLMDLRMPILNGLEAIQQIRSNNKKLPIIVQTAFAMNEEKEKSYKAGANQFVSKPIDPQQILQILKKYL